MKDSVYLASFREFLAALPAEMVNELLAAVGEELARRDHVDAANYCQRALACLDVQRLAHRL